MWHYSCSVLIREGTQRSESDEKKSAHAEGEKVLHKQAKKIKNSGFKVLYSSRGENHDHHKKGKRQVMP
uniref:Uncharacterized protein n=1 Tax=Rhizophora mucronata TaxID=61149 RepID=A0A2P2QQ52_RHIMU